MKDSKIEQEISLYKKELLEFQNMTDRNYLLFVKEKEGISRIQKITQISEKLHLLEMESLSRKLKKDNKNVCLSNFPVILDSKSQCIQIGNNKFMSFDDIYSLFRKNKPLTSVGKSQFKSAVSLIYAIVELLNQGLDNRLMIKSLLNLIKEFREEWTNWSFSKQGVQKKNINKNDCLRAEQILKKCGESIIVKISPDKTEIFVK